MKKVRLGIVRKCLIIIFIIFVIYGTLLIYQNYSARKNEFLDNKKTEALFALSVINNRVDSIKNNMLNYVRDLTQVFHKYKPDNDEKTELLKMFGLPPLLSGVGYVEIPGKNSFGEYLYKDNDKLFIKKIADKIPDYSTRPWFTIPQKSERLHIETPALDKISKLKKFMITFSFPYLNQKGEFEGVFVFDLDTALLTHDLDRFIKDDDLDVSLFFTSDDKPGSIIFIKTTKIGYLSNETFLHSLITEIKENKGQCDISRNINGTKIIGFAFSIFHNSVFVMTTYNEQVIMKELKNILYRKLILGAAVLLLLYVILFMTIKFSFKSIERISDNVIKISKGDFETYISVKSSSIEIIRLNEAIRKMQIQLKHYVEKMRKTTELNTEMKIAADIQRSVIPPSSAVIPGFPKADMFQYLKPAKEVSGDFYNYYMLGDDTLFMSIGDVTGKGVPASLFTVLMLSMEKLFPEIPIPMSDTLDMINRKIVPMNRLNIFISYFCIIINLKTGEAKYASAGHDPPLVRKKDGTVIQLEKGKGTFLGIFEDIKYSEEHYKFEDGDMLLMYTDGVTEAMNQKREMFGKDRTVSVLTSAPDENAENTIKKIVHSIENFTDKAPQSDDICMVCLNL